MAWLARFWRRVLSIADLRPLAFALLISGAVVGAVDISKLAPPPSRPVLAPAPVTHAAVLSDEEWANSLRSERAWQMRRSASGATSQATVTKQPPPAHGSNAWALFGAPSDFDEDNPPQIRHGGTYRTVCVRLCDGFYFPISFSTTRERFAADQAACESRCSSDAKLYVSRSPDGAPDDMVDLKGQPYSRLKTAFLYRTAYDASCKCKPHPWEQEAKLQHRVYALEEQRKKGNKQAVAELKEIRAAIPQPEAQQAGKRRSKTIQPPSVAVLTPIGPAQAQPTDGAPLVGGKAQRVAAMPDKPGSKAMRLGASPSPQGSSTSAGRGDWRSRALSLP